jgi:hypothetical protein
MNTIAELLYADEPGGRQRLEKAIRKHRLIESRLMWPAVLTLIAEGIMAFLDMPAAHLAASAYEKHRRIEVAKRETAGPPGTRQVVQLMKHTIHSRLEPKVEIEINGVPKTLLRLALMTELTIESVTAIVQSGHLVDITPGSATAEATLSASGITLAKAKPRPIDLAVPAKGRIVVDLTVLGEPIVRQVQTAG